MSDVTLKSVRGTGVGRGPIEPESVMRSHHLDPAQALATSEGRNLFWRKRHRIVKPPRIAAVRPAHYLT
ncbi:hypothetical protein [Bradyrhizobium sp. JYMT SZCCT0180]|uniref:hypothetical protein n=1 Tax=Bradyrhizobium sp. JYMT SZCCT0180 TaxID=2807666 RepID=UPI001BAB01FF|nr:hypothetical protein [Bradyrhizobium sp. JYMT SZCCT0180]MBR1209888.1 hypothetical protein [Bradyrhizobium sp. JYMT SZCCT0180]